LSQVEKVEKKTEKVVEKNFEAGDVLISFKNEMLRAQKAIDKISLSLKDVANLERKDKQNRILDPNFIKFTTAAFGGNYEVAKNCLILLLKKETSACQEVITLLNSVKDQKTIAYIVKRFVAILAYEDVYQPKTIGAIVARRSNMSAGLK